MVNERIRPLASVVLLAAVVWISHYWHSAEFGLYEDDYTRTPAAMTMRWDEFVRQVSGAFTQMSDHGKPLHSPLIYGLSAIGWRFGGLQGLYVTGYVMLTINTLLFYGLMRRLSDDFSALFGALSFALFTADTTQAFLTHSFGLQPSMTFFLLSAHAYLSGLPGLSYLFGLLVLLIYETPYAMLLTLPLFKSRWTRATSRELVWNAGVLGLLLLLVVAFRGSVGESRVAELGFPEIITTPLLHMIQGPIVSVGSWMYRIVQVVSGVDLEIGLVCLGSFVLFLFILARAGVGGPGLQDVLALLKPRASHSERDRPLRPSIWTGDDPACRWFRMTATGAALSILAYPLTFTIRAYALSGRDSRVHFAAVVGISILFASGAGLLLGAARSRRALAAASLILAFVLASWVGFAWLVQSDYVQAWHDQEAFWASLVPLIEDAGNGTAILVDPAGIPDTQHIGGNTWNLPRVLPQLYAVPGDWQVPPRVYRLLAGWQDRILTSAGLFQLNGATTTAPESLLDRFESTSVILIETASGELERRDQGIRIEGKEFPLKARTAPVLTQFEETELYRVLVPGG